MQSASYSIFVRDLARSQGRAPQLLAYDIDDRSAAEALVSVIAASYRDHGFNPATRTHWFRYDGSLHEIYAWPIA
ncbi:MULTISPECIES: hypothetical protein [Methylobacterium]|jgi:hypothetical protein|uniref:Uncharacterized protein n=1 Tax=Methylobacterium longum TaxID=767694 RepID=A0ABT8AZP2_9HYPH|nr:MULTISPECIES: hypothetical protein [Methylobacterium]MCJ2099335.1 hypothetical protein [Methylobacterium sp. E-046]MDN3574708.1 hypothetical protein [Methylobacterium longum]GJE13160.1 hypothetical protein FOHLNKBM_4222 [Methylobacterium longum]